MQLFALSLLLTAASAQYLSVRDRLNDNAIVSHTWMEIGYAQLNDITWTDIETTENQINQNDAGEVSVFLSLPDYGGPLWGDGYPIVPKIRSKATKTSNGNYKFSALLVQPNDSYCPKIWWTPQHSGDISVGWMVVENGVYNVSDTMFVIDSGEITRDNSVFIKQDTPYLYHAKSVHNYTTGCDSSDPEAVCTYEEKPNNIDVNRPWLHLGAIQQLQTSVNKGPDGDWQELYLSVRARHVFTDRIVLMLMTHSVFQNQESTVGDFTFPNYPNYETISTPEIVSYFIWEKDLRLKCVEGLVMETSIRVNEITSFYIETPYYFRYSIVPALFGMLGTLNSVADSTVLRVFNRTLTSASYITQEDQCTDEEGQHTTPESAFAMIFGLSPDYFEGQPQLTQCFIVYDKQACEYDILLIDAFGDGWANNYFEVIVNGEATRYDVPCGSQSIHISSTSCEFFAQMKCDGACKTTWENNWEFTHGGKDYYGDHDSTLHIKDHMVTVTDPVNVDPHARVNACEQCKIAPPKGTAAANAAAAAAAKAAADAAAAAAAAAAVNAQLIAPNVVVDVGAASPAASSSGAGVVTTYVVDTGVFFQFSASGTATPITGVSFSVGQPGENSASAPLHIAPGFPVDGTAAVEGWVGSFQVTEETVDILLAGGVYCVVSTVEFPNGELRGQVAASAVGVAFGLSPDNEVPAVTTSTASGTLTMYRALDDDGSIGALLYSLSISAPDGADISAVHFHAGAAGVNGANFYVFPLSPFTVAPGVVTKVAGFIPDDDVLAVFASGSDVYMNVHSTAFPSGELRGQIDYAAYDAAIAAAAESGSDDDAKAKPKPIVPVPIELFESAISVNGWYDNYGGVDSFQSAVIDRRLESSLSFPVPHILTYPKYTIANEWNTKLIASGSICMQGGPRAAEERCEEKLPANGKFIFRVTGWVPQDEQDTWKFCGVEGAVGQELQFEMVKGKCVPGQLIDAYDLCADGGSVVSVVTEILFEGVDVTEVSHYEALVFENEIAEMLGSVVSVSMNSYKQTDAGLLVTFGVNVAAERYNVDATVVDNIAPLVATLQSSLNRKLVNNLFVTSATKVAAAGYPRSSMLDATHAELVSFNYIGVKYVAPLPADMVVSYPAYNQEPSSTTTTTTTVTSSFSVGAVLAFVGVAVVVAFAAMKTREYSERGAKFEPLPTASEHVVLAEQSPSALDLGMETSGQEAL